MSAPNILFFINNPENSAVGLRAKMFAERLPKHWNLKFNYRPRSKWKGILPFIQSALAFKPDVIYIMDIAYTGVIAGWISKKLTNCKLLVDTGDATFALAQSTGRYSKPQLALIDWTEKLALSQADHMIVRGSFHKEFLAEQGIDHVDVVPDGLDLTQIRDVDGTQLKQDLGLADCTVIGLIGHMVWSEQYDFCYGWDIIEAMDQLRDLAVKALLIGDGDGRSELERRIKELDLEDRFVFTGLVPYEKLPEYLAVMDIGVSTQTNDLPGKVRTTGKLPLYLAYNLYVMATAVGEATKVLPNIGSLLPYTGVKDESHPPRLAAEIRKVIEQPELLNKAKAGRSVVEEYFDCNKLTQRVEATFKKLLPAEV
jgi:glycosyltransferase involved in cell wall biosynthesis